MGNLINIRDDILIIISYHCCIILFQAICYIFAILSHTKWKPTAIENNIATSIFIVMMKKTNFSFAKRWTIFNSFIKTAFKRSRKDQKHFYCYYYYFNQSGKVKNNSVCIINGPKWRLKI